MQYALHGHLPYDHTTDLRTVYETYRASAETTRAFETWFLPLVSLKEKGATHPQQLPALFKQFMRASLARPAEPDPAKIQAVQQEIENGGTDWITSRTKLATVIATSRAFAGREGQENQ
ncbi:hypothetical protein GXW82_36420 [Streptacidiphilus sp. 4-A2]|nr:hypothetical protein [Streptacidiphilus sp. 4-A2]